MLSRRQFATLLGVNRDTLRNYETGKTRPDLETECKIVEASGCSGLEQVETLCDVLSGEADIRVAIAAGERGYLPATSLARAEQIYRSYGGDLPEPMRRTLGNKMHTGQLMTLALERHNADLDEYAADCCAEVERRRGRAGSARSREGATGPAASAGPVSDNAGAGRRPAVKPSAPRGATLKRGH